MLIVSREAIKRRNGNRSAGPNGLG